MVYKFVVSERMVIVIQNEHFGIGRYLIRIKDRPFDFGECS